MASPIRSRNHHHLHHSSVIKHEKKNHDEKHAAHIKVSPSSIPSLNKHYNLTLIPDAVFSSIIGHLLNVQDLIRVGLVSHHYQHLMRSTPDLAFRIFSAQALAVLPTEGLSVQVEHDQLSIVAFDDYQTKKLLMHPEITKRTLRLGIIGAKENVTRKALTVLKDNLVMNTLFLSKVNLNGESQVQLVQIAGKKRVKLILLHKILSPHGTEHLAKALNGKLKKAKKRTDIIQSTDKPVLIEKTLKIKSVVPQLLKFHQLLISNSNKKIILRAFKKLKKESQMKILEGIWRGSIENTTQGNKVGPNDPKKKLALAYLTFSLNPLSPVVVAASAFRIQVLTFREMVS